MADAFQMGEAGDIDQWHIKRWSMVGQPRSYHWLNVVQRYANIGN